MAMSENVSTALLCIDVLYLFHFHKLFHRFGVCIIFCTQIDDATYSISGDLQSDVSQILCLSRVIDSHE